jgi:hypothetical protein
MNTRSVILKFAAVTSLAAAVLSPAWATVPLASFSQTSPGATPFFYNSHGATGLPNATFDSNTSVNFTYLGTARAAQTFNNANMSITLSTVTSTPSAITGVSEQPVNFTITFTTTQAQHGVGIGQTLLQMDAVGVVTGGFLGGILDTTSIGIQGTDAGDPGGPLITYSSTVVSGLNQNPSGYGPPPPTPAARDYSLSLTSLVPPLTIDTDFADFQDFHASISGVFGFTGVPEPGTVAMLIGLGCSSSPLAVRRLRRK